MADREYDGAGNSFVAAPKFGSSNAIRNGVACVGRHVLAVGQNDFFTRE